LRSVRAARCVLSGGATIAYTHNRNATHRCRRRVSRGAVTPSHPRGGRPLGLGAIGLVQAVVEEERRQAAATELESTLVEVSRELRRVEGLAEEGRERASSLAVRSYHTLRM
jgi:hypothetical protein